MAKNDSQPETAQGVTPEAPQDMSLPQANPAATRGPDSHALPQTLAPAGSDTDWEARYKGLQRKYEQDRQKWESDGQAFASRLDTIEQRLTAEPQAPAAPVSSEKPQAPEAPAPVSTGNAEPTGDDPLTTAIRAKQAQQYRDLVIAEMVKQGGPYEGLPLAMFADNISTHPPVVGADGQLDDGEQRDAVRKFADALKGVRGDAQQATEQALLEGTGPGSSPGPGQPGAATAQQLYEEFKKASEVMGSAAMLDLETEEQQNIIDRYYELSEDPTIQEMHEGNLRVSPGNFGDMWQQFQEMGKELKTLQRQVAKPG